MGILPPVQVVRGTCSSENRGADFITLGDGLQDLLQRVGEKAKGQRSEFRWRSRCQSSLNLRSDISHLTSDIFYEEMVSRAGIEPATR